jgi:hypothetical protein
MTRTNWLKYLVGLTIVCVIELVTYIALPTMQDYQNAHMTGMDWLPLSYILTLIGCLIVLFIRLWKKKNIPTTINLSFVVLALVHTTYLIWTIECSSCSNV